ncbi:anaphase-promoting complex, subunit 10/DOC domain-containing protein [Mrakia frigida]|uniref:anaphase promoting complex subunit DOC1 n=1 Tax=Mrakia frigida TaxID=29902 RepID=UPI003FCBFF78
MTSKEFQNAKDISPLATWSVSSHKFGFGVANLKDPDPELFWQSEGPQPHFISLQFPHRVNILKLSIYLSHPKDDSYTPQKLSIRAGTGRHDLTEVRLHEVDKPEGWVTIDLRDGAVEGEEAEEMEEGQPIPAFLLQIVVVANHLNGKDSHVRGLKVWGPKADMDPEVDDYPFSTIAMKQHECLR